MSRLQPLIDSVEGGVCRSLEELCQEFIGCALTDLTQEELQYLDESLFVCSICDWTLPVDDRSEDDDEDICQDCAECL